MQGRGERVGQISTSVQLLGSKMGKGFHFYIEIVHFLIIMIITRAFIIEEICVSRCRLNQSQYELWSYLFKL